MAGNIVASARAREASISAVITRADGTVEDLGVISYWHTSRFKRACWRLRQWLKGAL